MDNPRLFPRVARARDTVEALQAESGTPGGWIFWLSTATVAALLTALPLVHVTVTVRAGGIVRPVEAPVEIRAPAAGSIAAVFVQEDEVVAANQPLFEIASPESDEHLKSLRRQANELEALQVDLVALTEEPNATHQGIASVPAPTALRTPLYRSELARLRSAQTASTVEQTQAARELDRAEQLHARHLIADRDLDTAQHAVAQLRANDEATIAQTLARWQGERRQYEDTLTVLRGNERELVEAKARRLVRAPVAGDLIGFNGWKVGVFLAEGQTVAAISPPGALRVEATARSRDLAHLATGLPARIEVDAFPSTEWGFLDGAVESIDRDVRWIDGTPSRRMLVRLQPNPGSSRGQFSTRLQKGMVATVRVVVGRRSLWHYLTENTDRWLENEATSADQRSATLESQAPAEGLSPLTTLFGTIPVL
jgi:multidrug resistance efflux pump